LKLLVNLSLNEMVIRVHSAREHLVRAQVRRRQGEVGQGSFWQPEQRSLLKHISLFARYVSIMQKGKHYCENNELVECWLSSDTTLRLWRLISYGSSYRSCYEQNSNYLARTRAAGRPIFPGSQNRWFPLLQRTGRPRPGHWP